MNPQVKAIDKSDILTLAQIGSGEPFGNDLADEEERPGGIEVDHEQLDHLDEEDEEKDGDDDVEDDQAGGQQGA